MPAVPGLPGLGLLEGSAPRGAARAPGVALTGQTPRAGSAWAPFPQRCEDGAKSCPQPSSAAAGGAEPPQGWTGIWGGGGWQ